MIEQKPSSIGEAPSLDDIASSSDDDRVGQVDFSAQLGAEERAGDEPASGSVSLTKGPADQEAGTDPDAEATDDAPEQRSAPLILPPAKVDEAMAAEAARIRREVAEARGETIPGQTDEPENGEDTEEVSEATDQRDEAEAPDETVEDREGDQQEVGSPTEAAELETRDAVESVEQAESAPAARPRFRRTKPVPAAPPAPEPTPAPVSERLQIQDVASLDEIAEEVAAAEAAAGEAAARAEARADSLRRQSEEAAAAELEAASAASLAAGPVEDLDDLLGDDPDDLVPPGHDQGGVDDLDADDELAVDQSVADVAASVIAAMRAIGEANERHLEAVELEAARRCELLTAQAELDAELIRLHARREAHAIISAARMRAGEDLTPVETDQLSEIGETFSRFAESIETTIAPGPASPDTTRKS